jgi:hypothetical protein
MKKRACRIVVGVAVIALLFGIGAIQQHLTTAKDASWRIERMSYLPQTDRLKPLLLGFDATYAGYLWIRTMLYFGSHAEDDNDFTWLTTMVDMVTRLNPDFYPAYEFAGLMLPNFAHNPDAARIILNRGINAISVKKYRLYFYLGWLYYNSYHDYKSAAEYLSVAARCTDAPPYVAGVVATFFQKAGRVDMAQEFLQSLYQTTENPAVRQTIGRKLAGMQR